MAGSASSRNGRRREAATAARKPGGYKEMHRDDAAKTRLISPLKPSVVAARRQSLLLP
jgi:hypothetical protein